MSGARCRAPLTRDALLAYWLGELEEPADARLEEHLLDCGACAARLESLVELGAAIRRLVRRGRLRVILTDALPKRFVEHGLRVREYRVPCNGSVHCTIAPDDDLVVARLEAPLTGIHRLDVLILLADGQERLEHVPFNAAEGVLSVVPGTDMLRALPAATMRMRLVAVENGSDRPIGEYTFHHTPWGGPAQRPRD